MVSQNVPRVEADGPSGERGGQSRARSENACTSRAHRARGVRVGPDRGTANYYLIVRITEYNNNCGR